MNAQDWREYLLTVDVDELEHLMYEIEMEIQRREDDEQED